NNNNSNIDNNNNNNSLRPIGKTGFFTNYKPIFFKAINFSKNKTKLKRNNIGTFNPFTNNPEDIGIVESSSDLVYTNTTIFKDYLITLLEDNPNKS
ncbi:hypothetical protein OFC03_29265, partial [Escherichia coli]|nr:hypothetical protein [Escherichia coli]